MGKRKIDSDRKLIVFKHLYRYMYSEYDWVFWKYIDFDDIKNGVIHVKDMDFSKEPPSPELDFILKYKDIFTMSGDADITIKGKEGMHSFRNFSLMPCVGNLNCVKGTRSISTFLRVLNDFYTSGDLPELAGTLGNPYNDKVKQAQIVARRRQCLADFLFLVGSVDDYCEKLYRIEDKSLVLKLYGKDYSYEEKKEAFWSAKESYLKEHLPAESLEWLDVNINEIDDSLPIESLNPSMFSKVK